MYIYIQRKSTHSFFGAWSFFLVHIQFTPSEGPCNVAQRLYKVIFEEIKPLKLDHQVGLWKKPSFMVRLHGPWCKPTLQGYMSTMCLDVHHESMKDSKHTRPICIYFVCMWNRSVVAFVATKNMFKVIWERETFTIASMREVLLSKVIPFKF